MEKKVMDSTETWSRRRLLSCTAKLASAAAGIAIGSGAIQSWSPRTSFAKTLKWPWPYKKIEPGKAARIGYEKYYEGACCYGVVNAIILPLREAVGEPYHSLPLDAFRFGHAGVVGWGTICGTLLGCGLVTGFIAGKPGESILNEVIHWYIETALPAYRPSSPRTNIKHTSRSNSPLCHISAGRWMKRESVPFDSPQRAERCARLVADVAAKTANLLNEWSEKKFISGHEIPVEIYRLPAQSNCTDCHGTKVPEIPK